MITHIYSRRYLKKITLLTVTLLLILCFIFIAILSITNYDTTKYRIANSEYQRTENLLSQTDDYMNQLFSTCKTLLPQRILNNILSLTRCCLLTLQSILISQISS